jgi:hypothetical protein
MFRKSHTTYLKEKYNSILLELVNFQNICTYYNNENTSSVLTTIADDIKKISLSINEYYTHGTYGINHIEKHCTDFEFLVYLDIHQEYIESILHYINEMQKKVLQLLEEHQIQKLPFPSLQKRYSSKVLSELLDYHTNELTNLLTDEESTIFSSWSHYDTYQLYKPLFNNVASFGKHSFYYHDLVWTIPPVIDHEVILFSIEKNTYITKKIKNTSRQIAEKYATFIDRNSQNSKFYEDFLFFAEANHVAPFIEELVASFFAWQIHGSSYKYSFYHETLAYLYGREFWNKDKKDIPTDIIFTAFQERDYLIIRQLLLNYMGNTLIQEDINVTHKFENNSYITQLDKCLGGIIGKISQKNINEINTIYTQLTRLSEIEESNITEQDKHDSKLAMNKLKKCLESMESTHIVTSFYLKKIKGITNSDFPTQKKFLASIKTFIQYNKMMVEFLNISYTYLMDSDFLTTLIKPSVIEKTNNFIKKNHFFIKINDSMVSISESIWEKRFDKLNINQLPHRSILRKKLLKPYWDIEKLYPYVMEFKKQNQYKIDTKVCSDITLGIFNQIDIQERNENIKISMLNDENTELISSLSTTNNHFCIKHALLKIREIIGTESEHTLSVYLQLYLNNPLDFDSTTNIIHTLSDNSDLKKFYKKATVYKSLGPEDILCSFEIGLQKNAWHIAETLQKIEGIKDTFMTIQLKSPYKLHKEILIKQLIRLKTSLSFKEFEILIKRIGTNETHKTKKRLKIYDIEGTYDFELWWDLDNFKDIENTYNTLLKENHIDEIKSFLVSASS